MTTVTEAGSGTVLATYAYDPLSRRISLSRANGASTTWGYDAGDRLISLVQTMPAVSAADDLTLGYSYTQANQLLTRTSSNPVYDWNQFPTVNQAKTFDGLDRDAAIVAMTSPGYDQNGLLISEGTAGRQLTYDFDNRLTNVTDGPIAVALTYDPTGRLQQQTTTGSINATTQFLYDGSRLSAEYDGSGTLLRRYVHGPGSDEPIVWYEYAGGGTVRNWLHTDERGSVIAQSNDAGAVTTYAYGPWGEPQSWGGSRFRYTGQIALPEVQLYDYKARAYDPVAGRFLQTDPIGYKGGPNLYAYANGDPVNNVDPNGLYASVIVNGNQVTIQLPIQFTGSGLTPARQAAITTAIQNSWSGTFGQYNVTTTVISPEEDAPPSQVDTITVLDQAGVSFTNVVGGNESTIYTSYPGYPLYSNIQLGDTGAHEAGHLMGDIDYYSTNVVNGVTVSTANPGYENNLMANINGSVDQSNINAILDCAASNCYRPPAGEGGSSPASLDGGDENDLLAK